MIKDKISHLHKIWADLCKALNKPGGMTASEAIGTIMPYDQAEAVHGWYHRSGLVLDHEPGFAMDSDKFETTLKGLCGVVVDGKTLVQTPDGFKVTGDILTEAATVLRSLTTLSERSPDMPLSEDLYALAKVVEHKSNLTNEAVRRAIHNLSLLIDPNTSYVLLHDPVTDLHLIAGLLKEQAKREDQDRLHQINDLQDHAQDLREALGWSAPITGKRVTEALAMSVDRVKDEIMAVRETLNMSKTGPFVDGVREAMDKFKVMSERSAIETMRTTTGILDRMNEARAEIERLSVALNEKISAQDIATIFADDMARFKAANYLEYRFDTQSGTTYTVTVKRLGAGKTPGEVAADHMRRAKTWKALAKRLRSRLHMDAPQKDWTLAVTPIADPTPDQERAAILIWPTCKGSFKTGETQIMGYRGTAEQVAGVAEHLGKHGLAVAWERQT